MGLPLSRSHALILEPGGCQNHRCPSPTGCMLPLRLLRGARSWWLHSASCASLCLRPTARAGCHAPAPPFHPAAPGGTLRHEGPAAGPKTLRALGEVEPRARPFPPHTAAAASVPPARGPCGQHLAVPGLRLPATGRAQAPSVLAGRIRARSHPGHIPAEAPPSPACARASSLEPASLRSPLGPRHGAWGWNPDPTLTRRCRGERSPPVCSPNRCPPSWPRCLQQVNQVQMWRQGRAPACH